MTETPKSTEAYGPYTGNVETEETGPEKVQKEAQDKFQEMKEGISEKKEELSEKWSSSVEETRQAAQEIGQRAADAGAAAYDAISENLFPTILAGIGVAWLTANILRGRSESGLETEIRPEQAKSRLADKAKGMGEKMRERAREGTQRTREKSKEMLAGHSFYVAGALAVVGIALGLAFPATRNEQRWFTSLQEKFDEQRETSKTGEPESGRPEAS